ncbi:Hypp1890 [Branchiostoma lanceolatum]|uniref:Hypp1890 protein n=1 Tax=Branchiostoma lanceolatum TaxID=7740 RepID=A0A8K0EMS4_BRALA|nr:Hypp1890 [Branchiostoma lanceolatum]
MAMKMYSPSTFARYKMYMSPQERRLVKSAPDKLWSQPQSSWTSTTFDESIKNLTVYQIDKKHEFEQVQDFGSFCVT